MADQDISLVLAYLPGKYRDAYVKGKLTEDDLISWGKQAGLIKDAAPAAPKADFSNVDGGAVTVPNRLDTEAPDSYLGALKDKAVASLERTGAGLSRMASENPEDVPNMSGLPDFIAKPVSRLAQGISDAAGLTDALAPTREALSDYSADLLQRAGLNDQRAEKGITRALDDAGTTRRLAGRALADLAGSPESALSVFGGPTAVVPGVTTYAQRYADARANGMSPDEADATARHQATLEAGISVIPAGKILEKIPGVKNVVGKLAADELSHDALKYASKLGKNIVGEGFEEAATTDLQFLADKLDSMGADSKAAKDYHESQLPTDLVDLWDQTVRSGLAGAAGGASLGSVHSWMENAHERGKLAGKMIHGQVSSEKDIKNELDTAERKAADRLRGSQLDLFGQDQSDLPTFDEFNAQRQAQLEADARSQITKQQQIGAAYDQNNRRKALDIVASDEASKGNIMADALLRAGTDKLARVPDSTNPAAPAPTTAPVQQTLGLNEPLQPADSENLKRELERKRRADEARKMVEDDEKGIQGKAKSALAAARRAATKAVVEQSRSIENIDDRHAYVADAMEKWDSENPLENFVAETRKKIAPVPKKVNVKPVVKTAAPTVTEDGEDNSPVRPEEGLKSVADMKKSLGLKQAAQTPMQSNLTSDDVIDHIGKKLRTGGAKVAAKLIGDKNLVIVNDASNIPASGVKLGDTAGYYDGKRTYVVANQLDANNIMGDLLSVAAHETHHAANLSGKVTLAGFVGKTDTSRLRSKIEKLAENGNVAAYAAVRGAEASEKDNPGSYNDELLAYFINAARETRGGLAKSVLRDIVSAVRTKFGGADVNPDDVAYLSDKLLKAAALKGERLTADTNGLAMIGGKNATGFKEATNKYHSVDGNQKFQFSDADSSIHTESIAKLKADDDNVEYLYKVLDHPELYKQYPYVAGLTVTTDRTLTSSPDSHGVYHAKEKGPGYIYINKKLLNNPVAFKSTLLHEVQHFIQETEDHAYGSSPTQFQTEEHTRLEKELAATERRFNTLFELVKDKPELADLLPQLDRNMTKREFMEEVVNRFKTKPGHKSTVGGNGFYADKIAHTLASADNIAKELLKHRRVAYDKYTDTLGELEARYTQANMSKKLEDLPRNPEEHFDNNKPASKALITTKSGEVLGRADEVGGGTKVRLAQALNSRAVLAAQMVFHGTPHTFDPETGHPYGKFKDAKMGTGEGQQVFGWGHYLTQEFNTADKRYREGLSRSRRSTGEDPKYSSKSMNDLQQMLYTYIGRDGKINATHKEIVDDLIDNIEGYQRQHADLNKMIDNAKGTAEAERYIKVLHEYEHMIAKNTEALEIVRNSDMDQLNKMVDNTEDLGGETYYVDIPEDQHLANYDADLGDQLPEIQTKLRSVADHYGLDFPTGDKAEAANHLISVLQDIITKVDGISDTLPSFAHVVRTNAESIAHYLSLPERPVSQREIMALERYVSDSTKRYKDNKYGPVVRQIADDLFNAVADYSETASKSFNEWYHNDLAQAAGSDKNASKALHEAGVMGHYFQPPSQSKQTRNFVIYDENSLKITGRDPREKGLHREAVQPEKYVDRSTKLRRQFEEDARNQLKNGGLAFNISDFRNALKQVRNSDSKAVRFLKSQFDYKGGLGKELNELRENSVGDAALYAHRGMNAFGRINSAVNTVAAQVVGNGKFKSQTEAEASIKKEINDNLERIAALPDENRRASALSAWVRENPQYRPVADAVAEINQLSKTLLGQMLIAHPNPTPAQLRLMNTIHDNMFRYATRMYAAFQGEAGREHSRHMIDQYNKAKAALAKGKNVPAKAREAFQTYTNAMKYLIDHDLTIPEREGLEAFSTDRLGQLFDTWVGNAKEARQIARAEAEDQGLNKPQQDQFVREAMIEALDRRRETVTQAQLEGKADDLIKGMLGLHESAQPFATFYRGFTQDRTILEHREHLPQEIRDLFGEIKDPATRLAVTIAKQGELAARTRLLMDMKEHGLGTWVIPPEDAGLPGNGKFNVTLKGKNYGPLNGWRTTKTISTAIGSNLELYSSLTDAVAKSYVNTDAGLKAIGRVGLDGVKTLAGWQKIMSIVWDFYNIGNNFVGSPLQAIANGVVNPKHYIAGGKVGIDVIADSIFDNAGRMRPEYEDAIKYGLLDSARVQEIRATPQRVIRNMISDEARATRMAKSGSRRVVRGLVETFAMSDAWTKVTSWLQRVDHLTKFYKAEGIDKSEDEIKREAADQMKNTNITYSRVPPGIRLAESVGATTFMPYFYSVPRVIVHNYHLAVRDLVQAAYAKSDKGKMLMLQSGAARMAGATASTYGFTMLLKAIAASVNGDDKDKDEEMKKLMNQDARFADSIYLGKDAAGVPLFFRLSRVDPFGPTNDIMRVFMKDNLSPQEKSHYALQLLGGLVFSNRVSQALVKSTASFFPNVDLNVQGRSRAERIAPAAAEKAKDALTSLPHMDLQDAKNVLAFTDSLLPGIVDAVDPTNTVPKEVKGNDPWLKFMGQMAVASGGRLDRADPNMAAYIAGKAVEQARKDGRQRMADGFNAGSSASDLMKRYMDAANQEYLAMQQANDVYEGMTRGLDMTPRQASDVLKDGTKLTAADIHGLRTGRVNQEAEDWIKKNSGVLNESSLKQRDEANQRSLSPQEKKEREEAIKQFLKNMKAMGLKVQKEGKH